MNMIDEQIQKRRNYFREYRARNIDRIRQQTKKSSRKHYLKVKNNMADEFKKRYYSDPDFRLYKDMVRYKFMARYKARIFGLLGRKCARCSFSDTRALQFDHINGDGCKDRDKRSSSHYKKIYESVVREEGRFQVLCANCNWIKRVEENEHRRRGSITHRAWYAACLGLEEDIPFSTVQGGDASMDR